MFISDFGCRLPWMNDIEFGNQTDFCPILGHPNGTFHTLIGIWNKLKDSKEVQTGCKFQMPCIKSIYSKSQENWVDGPGPLGMGATLQIQFARHDVQVIEDHIAYDTQSFIGEVGGTLGLLLGLSFISIFELFEFILAAFERNQDWQPVP